ncbi:hypothetical protein V8B97DRAFT_1920137 [Scleroderma yunnanense]
MTYVGGERTTKLIGNPSKYSWKKAADSPQIATVVWTTDQIWELIAEIERPANLKALFGITKDPSDKKTGSCKVAVYQAIARRLIPEVTAICLHTGGERIKKKIEWLKDCYSKLAAKLKQTGEGLTGGDESLDDSTSDVYMDFYIPPEGPDENSPKKA